MVAAVTLGLVSLASNATTMSQLTGDAGTLLAVRSTISKLVNAGTVWAGLAIMSGWLVRRPLQAAAAGIVSGLTALVAHYSVGQSLGMFDSEIWTANAFWFTAAVAAGGPLGLIGGVARRSDLWGLLGRLTVPAGAVLEPFPLGMFTTPAILPWPDRISSTASGVVLLAAGVISGAAALVRHEQRCRAARLTADDPEPSPRQPWHLDQFAGEQAEHQRVPPAALERLV